MDPSSYDALPKIPAVCPVFNDCGGCQYQDIAYADELRLKGSRLKNLFKDMIGTGDDVFRPVMASPMDYGYRNRLDLKLVQTRSKEIFIGFSPKDRKRLIPVDACPIARQEISDSIPSIKEQAKTKVTEKHKQANIVVRTGDDGRIFWGGIGRRSLELRPQDYLWTEILGKRIYYSLDTFFQANLFILPEFITRLRSLPIWDPTAVFYDLYGGVGLFGISIYDLVGKVVLIEEVGSSLKVARHNAVYNGLVNFHVHEGRVEDVLPGMLTSMSNVKNLIMVDPPRAGLSDATLAMLNSISNAQHLLYLSCHPESLLANCKVLKERWTIKEIHPLDFFPRTQHLETLVVFERL